MLSPRGRYSDTNVPPMWFATGHDGFILQRRPEGWTVLVTPGSAPIKTSDVNATLGHAKAEATAWRIGQPVK